MQAAVSNFTILITKKNWLKITSIFNIQNEKLTEIGRERQIALRFIFKVLREGAWHPTAIYSKSLHPGKILLSAHCKFGTRTSAVVLCKFILISSAWFFLKRVERSDNTFELFLATSQRQCCINPCIFHQHIYMQGWPGLTLFHKTCNGNPTSIKTCPASARVIPCASLGLHAHFVIGPSRIFTWENLNPSATVTPSHYAGRSHYAGTPRC